MKSPANHKADLLRELRLLLNSLAELEGVSVSGHIPRPQLEVIMSREVDTGIPEDIVSTIRSLCEYATALEYELLEMQVSRIRDKLGRGQGEK